MTDRFAWAIPPPSWSANLLIDTRDDFVSFDA
jgi:hypothetical protein